VFRAIITRSAARPEIARLDTVLQAEALDRAHPAHDYFQARGPIARRVRQDRRTLAALVTLLIPELPLGMAGAMTKSGESQPPSQARAVALAACTV
jgi:hypothetical protein